MSNMRLRIDFNRNKKKSLGKNVSKFAIYGCLNASYYGLNNYVLVFFRNISNMVKCKVNKKATFIVCITQTALHNSVNIEM